MSLEMHLCVKEWSHNGPFEAHQRFINDGVQKLWEARKSTGTTRKTDLILFYLEIYVLFLVQVAFLPLMIAFLYHADKCKRPLFWQWTLSRGLTLFVCSVPVEAQDQCPCILGILLLYLYQEKDEITFRLRAHVSEYFWNHFFLPLSLRQFTRKRRFPAPKTQLCKTLS